MNFFLYLLAAFHLTSNISTLHAKHIDAPSAITLSDLDSLPQFGSEQEEVSDRKFIRALFQEALRERQSYGWLESLCEIGPRLSGSEGAAEALHWLEMVMKDAAFDQVISQKVMVPHWERGPAEKALIKDSHGGSYLLNLMAIGGSVATPQQGISAQVYTVESLSEIEEADANDVAGKIVFYNFSWDHSTLSPGASYGANVGMRAQGAIKAAEKGAVASLIRSVGSGTDDVPHTGVGYYKEGVDSIPAAALGSQSADLLASIVKLDPSAKVELHMHPRWYPDAESRNLIAQMDGSRSDSIIAFGGHIDSWDVGCGAHDDAAGCLHALGALTLLKQMGYEPRHTLRAVMFINEENGTRGGMEYASLADANEEKHIIAIESDAGGYSPRGFGFTGSEKQLAKLQSFVSLFPTNTVGYIRKGGGGVDIGPLHRSDGTPMMGLLTDNQKMFDLHHSANDTFDSVHPREMELGTAAMAAIIYLIDKYGL
ncbi:MAG: M20/M25/M40 family metallo-hydrolase [Saprospiraceae bacterium]|nr:M20/M25/M40 family metallo-hydrolase [Saprospiraceae bacterium]